MLPANYSKEGNTFLINEILSLSGGRLGFVGMSASQNPVTPPTYPLSNNSNALLNSVSSLSQESSYDANNLRLCRGVILATDQFVANSTPEAIKVQIVMLAGQISTPGCNNNATDLNNDGGIDSRDDAIKSACDAFQDHNIQVNTIGYGDIVDTDTLQRMADCGNGTFYESNLSQLVATYQNITNEIKLAHTQQTAIATGNITSKLWEDSYIEFDYVKDSPPFGLIITNEKKFDNSDTGTFNVSSDAKILETQGVSYSGPKWTNYLSINNQEVYNLTKYGNKYIELGDPYAINIPTSQVSIGTNIIKISTATSPANTTTGSANNKIIYTIVKNVTGYSPIAATAQGCIWTIQFEDDTNLTTAIPMNYTGAETCFFTPTQIFNPSITNHDAFQIAVFNLLKALDLNSNNKVDLKFTEEDIQIALSQLTGIPFTYSTEVQVRIWD